ncbi:MAG: tRNA pseudouridine(38-40) synthase TruA [Schwartzia sp.]|nr:tRNA pseudouridine(38-40) synthase TruA [Schwartzia sp. (in: firmicutes)]MBR5162486.1 tRNA pseudouridine(38-40) synthase TruA [Schwartzia sp. (in: firmicutes)]
MRPAHKEEMKRRARNICLIVAYDGTDYHGFQRQTPPVVAVQNVLEEALSRVFGDAVELAAAGRTDAGVHAAGQVVNFFTDGTIPVERVPRAVNSLLPPDIVVCRAFEADRDFSALHSASEKTYCYRILTGEIPSPFLCRYAWHIRQPLDMAAIKTALTSLLGTHDFSSFRAAGGAPISPVRTMKRAECEREGRELVLTFAADGFLYHMVRNIVGTLADVGRGVLSPEDFEAILEAKDRQRASATAPAAGLCLTRVEYDASWYKPEKD